MNQQTDEQPKAPETVAVFGGREDEPPDGEGDWTWVPGRAHSVVGTMWITRGWWQRQLRKDEELARKA